MSVRINLDQFSYFEIKAVHVGLEECMKMKLSQHIAGFNLMPRECCGPVMDPAVGLPHWSVEELLLWTKSHRQEERGYPSFFFGGGGKLLALSNYILIS